VKEARVWLGPDHPRELADAIERAGGELVSVEDANVIVWTSEADRPEAIRDYLHAGIAWVQLEPAGIDDWIEKGLLDRERTWTAAQGVYAADVAEHAVALILAAARRLGEAARRRDWRRLEGDRVAGKTVGIVGAGGIGRETIRRIRPFGVRILAMTRSGRPVPDADRSLAAEGLDDILAESDYVVLAVPLTAETRRLVGRRELALMGPDAWLINVGRGPLVDTEALVAALADGGIGGACLDVTEPEPLPDGHPLWDFDTVLVTPHVANPWRERFGPLAERVAENVTRFRENRPLVGVVDLERAY
jgi:phosphoglycerate dehydrogenase-like enzyme